MFTRRMEPTGVPSGARIRLPSRRKMGALETSRMVMLDIAMSSICAPSTDSRARPRERSKTTLEMTMLRKSPSDSVPILMRPALKIAQQDAALRRNLKAAIQRDDVVQTLQAACALMGVEPSG